MFSVPIVLVLIVLMGLYCNIMYVKDIIDDGNNANNDHNYDEYNNADNNYNIDGSRNGNGGVGYGQLKRLHILFALKNILFDTKIEEAWEWFYEIHIAFISNAHYVFNKSIALASYNHIHIRW